MRILHTADWHIGQTLVGHERTGEHRAALASLARVAADVEADALVVAGDVYDHQNPSGEAQRVFYDALVALRAARPRMTIVIAAGNHDAAGRLEAAAPVLEALDVHVVGNVRRRLGEIDAARHLIALRNAAGEVAAEVLAVSFPTAACLPVLARDDEDARGDEATRRLYADLAARTGAGSHGVPLIVTGHLNVVGGLASEGAERSILIGGEAAVSPDVFPANAAYVALGHLHRAQSVGRETIRYAGSLFPLSATEIAYQHGVTLVTLDGGRADIRHIPIPRPLPFWRVPADGYLRLDEIDDRLRALDVPSDLPLEQRPFLQLVLAREGLAIGYRAEIDRIAAVHPIRLLDPRIERRLEDETAPAAEDQPLLRLAEVEPADIFGRAFEARHGRPPEAAHLTAFDTLRIAALARSGG